ncbi:hypothetical protein BSKO_00853 [Bryopsis sp. KO-2023]|nr:hypothetical protein BSKO_00853 [Bryopsis sp. KO-2023]
MAASRPLVTVYDTDGNATGDQVALPAVFKAPIRTDIVKRAVDHATKNSRQAYAVFHKAGHQTSAESWGTGRAVSRIPRVPGGGTHRAGQGAFGNMCRGGRMFNPTKPWRKWCRKTNLNIRRYAMASAIAASALPSLLIARGHKIANVAEVPVVVDDQAESLVKTKLALGLLKKLGAGDDAAKAAKSRQIRGGKGKYRNRRYRTKKGPLVIYGKDSGIQKALANLPGVESRSVESMKIRELAPGGQVGRFIIWTKSAFEKLDSVFGTFDTPSVQKVGYTLPLPCVSIADMGRIMMSEEVQNVVRAPRHDHLVAKKTTDKLNPLTNKAAMLALNPYAAEAAAILSGKPVTKLAKDPNLAEATKKFYKVISRESEYQGEDYEQFTNWLGLTQS